MEKVYTNDNFTITPEGEYMSSLLGIVFIIFSAGLGYLAGQKKAHVDSWKCFRMCALAACFGFVLAGIYTFFHAKEYFKTMVQTAVVPEQIYFPNGIPDTWIWGAVVIVVLFGMIPFLLFFNCRKTAEKAWSALLGGIVAIAVLRYASMWGFYAVGSFFVLGSGAIMILPTLMILGTMVLLAEIVWTLYSFFGTRFGWKILAFQIGGAVAACAVLWLIAFGAAALCYGIQKNQARKAGIVPLLVTEEIPPEATKYISLIDEFRKEHSKLELPYESVYSWDPAAPKDTRIAEDRRAYTLATFDSPEMRRYGEKLWTLLTILVAEKNILPMNVLRYSRSFAYVYASRAALFLEAGHPEKILPELMKIPQVDREILNDSPFIISELVRIACRSIWYKAVVTLGPDGPEHAKTYREALQFMKSRKVHLASEAGIYLDPKPSNQSRSYAMFLARPLSYALASKKLGDVHTLLEQLAETEKLEVILNPKTDYEKQALKGRTSLVLGTTALALKCYRAEHGVYPDTLGKLVPEYLDKVPPCPYSGKPLVYTSDGRMFTLSLNEEKNSSAHSISSMRFPPLPKPENMTKQRWPF